MENTYIPKTKHGVIKIVKAITNVEIPTLKDLEYTRNLFIQLIESGLSSEEINIKLNLGFKPNCFAAVLRNCFNLTLKSRKEAVRNYCRKNGLLITEEKKRYFKDCSFNFKIIDPRTPGIELLKLYDFLPGQLQSSTIHLNKDHMVSKKYGWENNIDSSIISHPANCRITLASDNQQKGSNCSITLEELRIRINSW